MTAFIFSNDSNAYQNIGGEYVGAPGYSPYVVVWCSVAKSDRGDGLVTYHYLHTIINPVAQITNVKYK